MVAVGTKNGRWVGGVGRHNPFCCIFIRQQTHRQSGRDGDRRTAFSDNQHNHSQHGERKRGKEDVTLIESDESVKKSKEQKVKKE